VHEAYTKKLEFLESVQFVLLCPGGSGSPQSLTQQGSDCPNPIISLYEMDSFKPKLGKALRAVCPVFHRNRRNIYIPCVREKENKKFQKSGPNINYIYSV
jgi:hypothetical protein